MMSNTRKKLTPIGSNMNDAAYPFRGQHKLDDCINHGHSGTARKASTSLAMRITGSNLVIEQVATPKGVELECELGVDGGIPRPVSLQQASALMVPGDGHDYNLTATATAKGATSRHYCRLTFNGSERANVLRVRAPEGFHPDALYIVADGRRLRPTAGWFRIPIQTKECVLVAHLPAADYHGDGSGSAVSFPAPPRRSAPTSPVSPTRRGRTASQPTSERGQAHSASPAAAAAAPEHFLVETVPGPATGPDAAPMQPLLVCTTTGHVIPLTPHGTVAVPLAGAPYRLVLPAAAAPRGDGPGLAGPGSEGRSASAPPLPAAAAAAAAVPELETRVLPPSAPNAAAPSELAGANGMPSFVASAPGFSVALIGEDGSSASGQGVASLPLPHRRAQAVQIIVSDAQGKVVLRQKSHVPPLQSAPVALQVRDDGNGGVGGVGGNLVVATQAGNKLTVGGVLQANPAAGAVLPRVVAQQVTVEQPNPDGTVSALTLDVAAKGAASGPVNTLGGPAPVPVPLSGAAAPVVAAVPSSFASPAPASPSSAPEKWVMELCTALQKPNPEDQRRLTQAIQPSTLPGMTIVNFVRDQLTRQPPAISFTVSKNGLDAVQCPGCTITATVGSDPPRSIPNFGSVQLTPGKPAVLTATSTSMQRPVSACRVQMSNNLTGLAAGPNTVTSSSAGYNPYGSSSPTSASSPDGKADTELVTRVLDSLIRHNVNAPLVANELASISSAPFSAQGRRMLPLLTSCLRSASATGAAAAADKAAGEQAAAAAAAQARVSEEIFFTCGPGYVDNVYTNAPQVHLFAAIDDQAPQVLQQRGRVPAQGVLEGVNKPFFIRITARDPATGAVRNEKTITVLGVAPPSAQANAPAASVVPLGGATPLDLLTSERAPSASMQAPPDAVVRGDGSTPAVGAAAPASGTMATNAPMPYMDVFLQTVGQDVQARFLCPPHLRIVCDVDGVGGSTGQSDFVTKMAAARCHRVNLSLVDLYGKVVFQQKLDVPAMSSPVWGLAVQHNGLSVDPESGSLATASVDRSPERALQGNFIAFDASTPHYVALRKYLNGLHGSCVGEVSLRLPGVTVPPELAEVVSILRRRATRQLSDPQAKTELQQLRARCTSPAIAELIGCILDSWSSGGGGGATSYGGGPDSPSSRVFFRLTGTD